LFQPISLVISDKNVVVAVTKVFGYATMVFGSLTLVMTTRDAEVAGTLRPMQVLHSVSSFAPVVLRSLSLAVLEDLVVGFSACSLGQRPTNGRQCTETLAGIQEPA
ncbi:MAG TPA: hypothetical protein VJK02_07285, partial [Anaerolineales bacterium]|nr:hypothetical protein [Anaerolineales bacterium]